MDYKILEIINRELNNKRSHCWECGWDFNYGYRTVRIEKYHWEKEWFKNKEWQSPYEYITRDVLCMYCRRKENISIKCSVCGEIKNISYFMDNLGSQGGDRLTDVCINCREDESMEWWGSYCNLQFCERCGILLTKKKLSLNARLGFNGELWCKDCIEKEEKIHKDRMIFARQGGIKNPYIIPDEVIEAYQMNKKLKRQIKENRKMGGK